MKKVMIALMMLLGVSMGTFVAMPAPEASAATIKESTAECQNQGAFFALRPWYAGLTTMINGRCEVGTPDDIPLFVWTIVLNILYDIMVLIGYLATVMIAWGGFLYMFSSGDPGRAAKGKKTLIAAIVGLAIAMLASVIMNTLVTILNGNAPS